MLCDISDISDISPVSLFRFCRPHAYPSSFGISMSLGCSTDRSVRNKQEEP